MPSSAYHLGYPQNGLKSGVACTCTHRQLSTTLLTGLHRTKRFGEIIDRGAVRRIRARLC